MATPRIDLGSEQLGGTLWSSIEVVQALNEHWTCKIVLRDTPDQRPAVEGFAGKPLKISTYELDGSENVIFAGVVHRMKLIYEVTGAFGAQLDAISTTMQLDQGPRLAYFKKATAKGAATKALASSGVGLTGAMPDGATLSYVQWEESNLSFMRRLVDDQEAWFRPAVDGSNSVEVQTAFQDGPTLEWRQGEYGLLSWSAGGQLQPISSAGSHYDHQPMQSKSYSGVSSEAAFLGDGAGQMVAAVRGASAALGSRRTERHRAGTLREQGSRLERESRRGMASAVTCTGISRDPHVRAGDTLTVSGLPGVDATYGTISCRHVWTTQGYENHFVATPASRWSPAERPPRPSLDGLYPARVIGNHDPHNQARVQVQFYWQEDGATTWVRLLSSHAGPDRGILFLPELGEEVQIAFEEGDAERPYVLGSTWNGVHQAPATGFHMPDETNGSEFAANNIKRIVTKSGHRITIVDTPGKETISLATPTSNRIMLTENHEDTGRPAIVMESEGDMIFAAPHGRIHRQAKFHSREVGVPQIPHDHHFVLHDPITDKPLANVKYQVRAPDGTIKRGVTDGAGRTEVISTGYAPGVLRLSLDMETPHPTKLLGRGRKGAQS